MSRYTHFTGDRTTPNSNHVRDGTQPGVEIVSRVFGLILASIAITSLVIAIKMSFGIPLG